MTKSKDYLEFLSNYDIRAVTTTAGRVIVGEFYSESNEGLFLINAFVFDTFGIEPLYPFSFGVPALILKDRIETTMEAGVALKEQYHGVYVARRAAKIISDLN